MDVKEKQLRPQFLSYRDENDADLAIVSAFVAGVGVIVGANQQHVVAISSAGGMSIVIPIGTSSQQANAVAEYVRMSLYPPDTKPGMTVNLNKVVEAVKKRISGVELITPSGILSEH
jgi:uncharacterized protein YjlB